MYLFWKFGRKTPHRKTQTHISMPLAGFETAIPVFEWSKTVRILDRHEISSIDQI